MIRKITADDSKPFREYVNREPSINVFIIADVENYGFNQEFQEVWGDFDGSSLRAVLLRYYSIFVLYSEKNQYDENGIAEILASGKMNLLSGELNTVSPLSERFNFRKITKQYLAELIEDSFRPSKDANCKVIRATANHAGMLHRLTLKVSEFTEFGEGSIDSMKRKLENESTRTYFIREGSSVISTVSTNVECSTSAMIGGVMTHPDRRNRGLASACLSVLCQELLSEGKRCNLHYHNPIAGRLYNRLGFKQKARWMLCSV